jgi:hypothetical protein
MFFYIKKININRKKLMQPSNQINHKLLSEGIVEKIFGRKQMLNKNKNQ